MPNRADLSGQRFGRLVAIRPLPKTIAGERLRWACICDCGVSHDVTAQALSKGNVRSCGCLQKEMAAKLLYDKGFVGNTDLALAGPKSKTKHGMHLTKEYQAWNGMRSRCLNPRSRSHQSYGGRGIKICDRWLDFENFFADMGPAPDGMTLERKDVNGNYEPNNCIWASDEAQRNNKRNSLLIEYQGQVKTATQWERHFSLRRGLVAYRYKHGWPLEELFSRPDSARRRRP